jgi:hypothetical protein
MPISASHRCESVLVTSGSCAAPQACYSNRPTKFLKRRNKKSAASSDQALFLSAACAYSAERRRPPMEQQLDK